MPKRKYEYANEIRAILKDCGLETDLSGLASLNMEQTVDLWRAVKKLKEKAK